MDQYSAKSKSYSQELGKINKIQHNQFVRLLCIVLLGSLYYYIQDSGIVFMISAALFLSAFIVLMRIHSKLLLKERLTRRSKLMKMKSLI
jgi:hypothetical protein